MSAGEIMLLSEIERAAAAMKRRRLYAAILLGASIVMIVAAVIALVWNMIPAGARIFGLALGVAAGALLAAAFYMSEPSPPRVRDIVVEAAPGEAAGLGPVEEALLEALARHGWRARVGVLAEEVGVDPGEVLPVLLEMERKGALRIRAILL